MFGHSAVNFETILLEEKSEGIDVLVCNNLQKWLMYDFYLQIFPFQRSDVPSSHYRYASRQEILFACLDRSNLALDRLTLHIVTGIHQICYIIIR